MVRFLEDNEDGCVNKSDSYLSIYTNDTNNNLSSFLHGKNNGGYTILFIFDRDNKPLTSGQALFAIYENISDGTNATGDC